MSRLTKMLLGITLVMGLTIGPNTSVVAGESGYSLSFKLPSHLTKCPVGVTIEFTVKAKNGKKTYTKSPANVHGKTAAQVRDMVFDALDKKGWTVTKRDGTDGEKIVDITSFFPDMFTGEVGVESAKGSANKDLIVKKDCAAKKDEAKPEEDNSWRWFFEPPNADENYPGSVVLTINEWAVSTPLDPGDTPAQAAEKLATELSELGFIVDCIGGDVIMDWEDPTNYAMLGDEAYCVLYIEDAEDEMMSGIEGPGTPAAIPTLTEWGVIIMCAVMAVGVVWFVVRQRRRIAAA